MAKSAPGETVGTVNCPFCGGPITLKKSAKSVHGTCQNPKCRVRLMASPKILKNWFPTITSAPVPDVKGKESLGLSGPEPVAESPPTPPDNHEPEVPEPAAPEAAPIKTLPVAEPKAAEPFQAPEMQAKEVSAAPSPFPVRVTSAPVRGPSLFKIKKKEESDNGRKDD